MVTLRDGVDSRCLAVAKQLADIYFADRTSFTTPADFAAAMIAASSVGVWLVLVLEGASDEQASLIVHEAVTLVQSEGVKALGN